MGIWQMCMVTRVIFDKAKWIRGCIECVSHSNFEVRREIGYRPTIPKGRYFDGSKRFGLIAVIRVMV